MSCELTQCLQAAKNTANSGENILGITHTIKIYLEINPPVAYCGLNYKFYCYYNHYKILLSSSHQAT